MVLSMQKPPGSDSTPVVTVIVILGAQRGGAAMVSEWPDWVESSRSLVIQLHFVGASVLCL